MLILDEILLPHAAFYIRYPFLSFSSRLQDYFAHGLLHSDFYFLPVWFSLSPLICWERIRSINKGLATFFAISIKECVDRRWFFFPSLYAQRGMNFSSISMFASRPYSRGSVLSVCPPIARDDAGEKRSTFLSLFLIFCQLFFLHEEIH